MPVAAGAWSRALVLAVGGGIGDALYSSIVMRALRRRAAHITALVLPQHADVISAVAADDVWVDDGDVFALARRIRAGGFDAGIVTWASARSAYALRLSGVPVRVGAARRLYSPLFTKRVAVPSEFGDRRTHWSEIQLNFARAVDCDGEALPLIARDAAGDRQARELQQEFRVAPRGYAMLHPSRGITAARPSWPTSTFADLASRLQAQFAVPVFISGSENELTNAVGIARRAAAHSIAGRLNIRGFAAFAADARFVVAMDSGPMHIAAGTGTPTVGLFAMRPDEPDRWRPLGRATGIVRPAYPCPYTHTKENCPDFACVRALDCTQVSSVVAGLLANSGEEVPL